MLITGLSRMLEVDNSALSDLVKSIGLPPLDSCLAIRRTEVNHISGWRAEVVLPDEHSHRTYRDIQSIITKSNMRPGAQRLADEAFHQLAVAEGAVHQKPPEEVTFHEVGALDSILDVCLAAILVDQLAADRIVCSPLPVCDGSVNGAHGILSTPVPAVLILLQGVPVYGIDSEGETVTPTAIAFLKALRCEFGPWPAIQVEKVVRVYGSRILPNIPNGAIFALGYTYE